MRNVLKISTFLVFFVLAPNAFAASFDCNKATTQTEKTICANPELSALDTLMSEKFLKIKGPKLISEQKSWIFERDKCDDVTCLRDTIIDRIDQLDAILDGVPKARKRFHCEIESTQFKIYNDGGAYGDWFVVLEAGITKNVYDVVWETQGTGTCRYWMYNFDIDGVSYRLEELSGCSPDGAYRNYMAQLRFRSLKFPIFCNDPYKLLPNIE